MSFWSDIISSIGNGANDVGNWLSGNNQKKQQNNPAPANPKVNLPQPLQPAPNINSPKPIPSIFTPQNNQNLTAQPITPMPVAQPNNGGGAWHDLLHNPITNAIGDVGKVVATDVPEAGLLGLRVASGALQGFTQLPHLGTSLLATGTQALNKTHIPGVGVLNNVAQGINTGTKDVTNFVDTPLNAVNKGLDKAAQNYSNVAGLDDAGAQFYKYGQIPANVALLATGLGEVSGAGKAGEVLGKVSHFLNAPRVSGVSSVDNAISGAGGAVQKVATPVVNALNRPLSTAKSAVSQVFNNRTAAAIDAGNASSDAQLIESGIKPTEEPTITNAPTSEPITAPAAPESGIKPIEQPAPVAPAPVTPEITAPIKSPASVEPLKSVETPADVKLAQNTAQQAVDKSAETVPAPVEPPVTSTPAISPAQDADVKAAESPAQIASNEVPAVLRKKDVPQYAAPHARGQASVPGTQAVPYTTGDPNLDKIINDSIISHKGTSATADSRASALNDHGISSADITAIRNAAVKNVDKQTGKINAKGIQQIKDILTTDKISPVETPKPIETPSLTEKQTVNDTNTNPTTEPVAPAPVGKLGTITHNAVVDGSINTPEGIAKVIQDTTAAAHAEAQQAGDSLENIIQKGQKAWEQSDARGKDLTPVEAQKGYTSRKGNYEGDPTFTPEQQQVYKDYSQEISTLRDRSGHSLTGGNKGEWYGPRQFLQDGKSAEFNPKLVNELKRTGVKVDTEGNRLDYSQTPYEHYIQRYADAPRTGVQRITDAIETDKNGNPSGIKLPDSAKQELEQSLKDITAKRDTVTQLQHEGKTDEAKAMAGEIGSDINKAFNKVIDNIPGKGAARRAAISNVKSIREPYRQSIMQVLSLSNVVNRGADQGGKLVATLKRPGERLVERMTANHYANIAKEIGADINKMNNSKEAIQAAREIAKGSLSRSIKENAKAAQSQAGAGHNPLVKGIAKVAELPSTLNSAATQFGDLGNQNVMDALRIGASTPGAKGLKTVAEYKKYLGKWMQTDEYKRALAGAEHENNRQIGLSGSKGDNMSSGGGASKFVSKYADNGVRTLADHYGINTKNPLVQNLNDTVKGNVTGYAGVGSRILGYTKDALTFGKLGSNAPLNRAAKMAASGDPLAVAKAQQIAGKQIMNSIATYGTAGAVAALSAGPLKNLIGYTGPLAPSGSSQASYNKSNNVPPNQWYLNLPNGNRMYINATRTFNTPGVAADLVGTAMTAKDPVSATGDIASQIYNQAGGSTLPKTVVNATTWAGDPHQTTPTGKYASEQLQQTLAPSTGILNNVANWLDPTKRAPTNFVDDIKSNIPGFRSQTPVAKDSRGNPIPNSKQFSGGSSVFSLGDNPDSSKVQAADPVTAEINRLQKISGSVFPTNQNTNAKANANTQTFAKMLLNDPLYKQADDQGKADYMKNVLAGTSTKDISPSLDPVSQQALLDYKLVGNPDQQQVWLQNNDNAVNYYNAKINQAKATNGYSNDMQDTSTAWTGSGNSLLVNSLVAKTNQENNVSQSLVEQYDNTSKAEYNKMSGPAKDALTQYAKQLNANGVIDRFGISTGTSGRSGSSPTFHIPSTSSGLTAGSAKYVAPTLKTATASTTNKGNPFIRSITHSSGVK